jgi:hypothetical protein
MASSPSRNRITAAWMNALDMDDLAMIGVDDRSIARQIEVKVRPDRTKS